jgi:sigma-B regulation protein RsbU (phosphoserine phosphatase)
LRGTKNFFKDTTDYLKFIVLAVLSGIAFFAIYYFKYLHQISIVFTHFFYIPLVLAGLWLGRKAVWLALVFGIVLIMPDFTMGMGGVKEDLVRVLMFVIVSFVIGVLRERSMKIEKEINMIIDTSGDGMRIVDINFDIRRVNRVFCDISETDYNSVIGKKCYDVFPGDDCFTNRCPMVKIFDGIERVEDEVVKHSVTGKKLNYILTVTPWFDETGEKIGIVENYKNIESRKAYERKIAESERRFREMLDKISLASVFLDTEGNLTFCNNYFCKLAGWTKEDIYGCNWFEKFILPKHRERFRKEFLELVSGAYNKDSFYSVTNVFTKHGEKRYIAWNSILIYNSEGQVVGLNSIGEDITEKRETEKNRIIMQDLLVEQKEFSENIIKNLAVPAFVISPDHKVLVWNKGCEDLTGIKAEEVVGTNNHWKGFYTAKTFCLADILIGDVSGEQPTFDVIADSEVITGGIHAEAWRENALNEKKYLVKDAAPIFNNKGELKAVIEIIQDFTEWKTAENDLRSSEEVYRTTFEEAAVGIAHVNLEGRLFWVNKKFCEITGYSLDEVNLLNFRNITYHADIAADEENLKRLIAGEDTSYNLEKRYVRKNDSLVWINITVTLIKGSEGSPSYFIGVIEDISARKAEEANRLAKENCIKKELILASYIQASIFPIRLPSVIGLNCVAYSNPAQEVGGDYCDLFINNSGQLVLAIGDVMGKGIPAALFVSLTYAFVRNLAMEGIEPAELITNINSMLFQQLKISEQFLTLVFALYDPNKKSLIYSNAGHNYPIIYRAGLDSCEFLKRKTYFVGGKLDAKFYQETCTLQQGDVVLFYTDGLKEGRNRNREQFGIDRITEILALNHRHDVASIQEIMVEEFEKFLDGEIPIDDVSMTLIKVLD